METETHYTIQQNKKLSGVNCPNKDIASYFITNIVQKEQSF